MKVWELQNVYKDPCLIFVYLLLWKKFLMSNNVVHSLLLLKYDRAYWYNTQPSNQWEFKPYTHVSSLSQTC